MNLLHRLPLTPAPFQRPLRLIALVLAMGPLASSALAAIAQRGTVTTANNSGDSVTITKPTGVVSGDVMIASTIQYNSGGGVANATSAGWTLLKSNAVNNSTTRRGTLLYKVAGASEPANYTFTLAATVSSAAGAILAFSGVDSVTPFDVDLTNLPAFTYVNSTPVSATSITTITANAATILFGQAVSSGSGSGGTWSGWSAGLAEVCDYQGAGTANSATSLGAAWTNRPTPGSTGAGAATLSTAMRNGGLWVALRPFTNPADPTNSTVTAAPASTLADGVTTSTITVTLKDTGSVAVVNRTVTLASSRGATDSISAASGPSSSSGTVTFAVSSTTPGSPYFTATDVTDNVIISQTATVTFIASSAKDFLTFGTNVVGSSAVINTNSATIAWLVPYGSDVTTLAPIYTLAPASSGAPPSGTSRDFSTPKTYTTTAQDLSTKIYTVTVTVDVPSTNKDILTFTFPTYGPATITGTNITMMFPSGTPVTGLSPAYTLPLFASGAPASGTTLNFSTAQTYIVTAQDGSSKGYRVSVTVTSGPQTYCISASTDVAQEFSPMNRSGHPVVTGLTNYPNSTAPKSMVAAQMKAPWNTNLGTQTMLCSDCHDATTTNYVASASQGPHGSANPYLLRGPNANNWPDVVLSSGFNSSWCANCHNNSAGEPHTRSDHSARRCYECHIVVPHGGKLSRLIADGNSPNMPTRYAFNGDTNLIQVTGFTKQTTANYSETDCGARCDSSRHALNNGDQW